MHFITTADTLFSLKPYYCSSSYTGNLLMTMSEMLLLDILFRYCEEMDCENILYNNRTLQRWKTCLVLCCITHFMVWKGTYCWVLVNLHHIVKFTVVFFFSIIHSFWLDTIGKDVSKSQKLFVSQWGAETLVDFIQTANSSHSLNRRSQFQWPPNTLVT